MEEEAHTEQLSGVHTKAACSEEPSFVTLSAGSQ